MLGAPMVVAGGVVVYGTVAAIGVVSAQEALALRFFEGTSLHPRVLGQIKSGDFHAFPKAVDGVAAKFGNAAVVNDSRVQAVTMLTVRGEYRGAQGVFKYIKNNAGQIYHRLFKPN